MTKHALIGGGTGFIGKYLAGHLRRHGYDVTIVSRMPGLGHISWHDISKIGIPQSVNAVVNVAGQNVLDPTRRWTPGFKQNVWNSRINTSAALAKVISESKGVEAFVNISGVSHYKPANGRTYSEYDPVEEFDYMSRLCVEWEKAANVKQTDENKCRVIKIRTGVVVGREGGMVKSMWLPFQLGLGGPLGDGKQVLPWIHIEDLCRLIQYSIEQKNVQGILNAVAPDIVTNMQFSKTFASSMHRPCLFFVPKFLLEQVYGKDRSALLFSGANIMPKRTLEVGFKFKYPTVKAACDEVVQKRKPVQ